MQPDTPPDRLFAEAQHAHRTGQLAHAAHRYRQVLAQVPDHADALHLLGVLTSQQGQHHEAAHLISQAIALDAQRPDFHTNLGEVQRRQGALDQAVASYRRALHIAPDFAEAHYNLANVRKQQGHRQDAISHYEQALQANPDHVQAHYNLGNALLEQGDYLQAVPCYKHAIALKPDFADAYINLGNALNGAYHIEEALTTYRQVITLQPDNPEAYRNAGQILFRQGKMEEARQMHRRVLEARPDDDLYRLTTETLCPLVPFSTDEIDRCRENVLAVLERYAGQRMRIDMRHMHTSDGRPPYMLMYHGRDDRTIKERWAALYHHAFPPPHDAPRQGLPHIGFVVASGHEDTFARCMGGFLDHLPREQFRLTVVCNQQGGVRKITPLINSSDVPFLTVPARFDQALHLVQQAQFDVLIYWEVGSDVNTYFLPFCRPAPVQCATWGNPVTTGIPAIAYFISSEGVEDAGSEQFYSETLIRLKLPTLPTCYRRPAMPLPFRTRAQFGLPETQRIYHCSQNMRKIHPEVDTLFGEILRRDPNSIVLLIEDNQENITRLMQQRMQQHIPDVAHRVHFFRHLTPEGYRNLIAVSDVFLDTPSYANGLHTLYDAFAMGVPVVTMQGTFMRSRFAAAAYRQMDMPDCIATTTEEYVERAVRLGTDADYHRSVSNRIANACSLLFERREAVDELAGFLQAASAEARQHVQ